jgi:hypothetical protein
VKSASYSNLVSSSLYLFIGWQFLIFVMHLEILPIHLNLPTVISINVIGCAQTIT